MRKVSLRHVEKGIVDPDASTWCTSGYVPAPAQLLIQIAHNFLRRDSSKDELINFKRRVPPRPSQATRGRNDLPNPAEIEYGSDPYSSPDAYHQHLFDEQQQQQQYAHGHAGFQSGGYQHTLPPPSGLLASPLPMMDRIRPAPIAISSFSQMGASEQPHFQAQSLPQTAPLSNTLMSTPVTRGHNRTRSYQCNSPLNPNANLTQNIMCNTPTMTASPHSHTHSKSLSASCKPLYNPLDPSSWAKRGYTDFDGNPVQVSSSVPANFASSTPQSSSPLNEQHHGHAQAQGQGHMPGQGQDQAQAPGQGQAQSQWTPSPPQHSFSSAISVDSSPTTPVLEGTISPAVFRPGYTPPAGVPMPMPQSSSPFSSLSLGAHQRRPSHPQPTSGADVPTHPGPTGTRSSLGGGGHARTLSLGEQVQVKFPTVATRRASEMDGIESALTSEPVEKKSKMDEDTLPSAALGGFSRLPFEGMLPEQDEPMN